MMLASIGHPRLSIPDIRMDQIVKHLLFTALQLLQFCLPEFTVVEDIMLQ